MSVSQLNFHTIAMFFGTCSIAMTCVYCHVFVLLQYVLSRVTDGEFLPNDILIKFFAKNVCPDSVPVEDVCSSIIFLVCGLDVSNLNVVSWAQLWAQRQS